MIDVAFAYNPNDLDEGLIAIIPSRGGGKEFIRCFNSTDGAYDRCADYVLKNYINAHPTECIDLLKVLEDQGLEVYIINVDRIDNAKYIEQRETDRRRINWKGFDHDVE